MTGTAGCLSSHPQFLCNIQRSFSVYRFRIYEGFLCEMGILKDLPTLLAKYGSQLPWCPASAIWTAHCQSLSQAQFLAQWLALSYENKLHMEILQCLTSFLEVKQFLCIMRVSNYFNIVSKIQQYHKNLQFLFFN